MSGTINGSKAARKRMRRGISGALALSAALVFAQTADTSKFDIADVHLSPKATTPTSFLPFVRAIPVKNGRYEIHNGTMVDLIRLAWDFDQDKILGGPNWLEMTRYDVIAKAPSDATAETVKPMLQALLADRFKLVVKKETRPLPTYALSAGKKPLIKAGDASGDTGCHPQASSGPAAEGGIRLMMAGANGGNPVQITLGPGMLVTYQCRNVTMDEFAGAMRGMLGAVSTTNPVLNQTGLEGKWSFDVKFSAGVGGGLFADQGDRIPFADAIEKQLGLKLEQVKNPTPVLVVESVNEKPTDNPPGVAEALPAPVIPKEFEVADIKPSDPAQQGGNFQMQPGGRLNMHGLSFSMVVNLAFGFRLGGNSDLLAGVPKWADSTRYDIVAKAPAGTPQLDTDSAAPLLRALLVDRFKMTYHTEERPVSAYSLVAAKPKLKKADPANRSNCKNPPTPPPGTPQGVQILICQNITMAQFADLLLNRGPGMQLPILDATGLEGNWDFTLSYNPRAGMQPIMLNGVGGGGRGGGGEASAAVADTPSASDPTAGYTIFEALEKELGLKLELQKRPMQVTVIDHLEEKPTEN